MELNPRPRPDVAGDWSEYVEYPSDHAFTAFLASLTPSRVLLEREKSFSKVERKHLKFLRKNDHVETVVRLERLMECHMQIAMDVLARQEDGK